MGIFTAVAALFGKTASPGKERQSDGGPDGNGSAKKATVLVIDDDPSFLDTMRSVLANEGYNVLTSSNGAKGLDMIRYTPRDIGAVLLDFNMPRFNGAETLQFLRQLSPAAKVLAVSGVKSDELPSDFRDGVERFIPKPFSNAELLKTLDEVLQDQRTTQSPA